MDKHRLENIAIVAKAYAKVEEKKELPSIYPPPGVKNPETMYVPKEGKKYSSALAADYDQYPFEIFRPYVQEVRRDSQGVYYGLCDEFLALLRKA
jgi:hypothetical protein